MSRRGAGQLGRWLGQQPSRELRRQLETAETYTAWLETAQDLDHANGHDEWREDDDAPELASDLLRDDIARMQSLGARGDLPALGALLHESIYRHQGDLTAPHLYAKAHAGTKHIVDDYLDAISAALHCFVDTQHDAMPTALKVETLRAAQKTLGRAALLLSGGASMGFFHLGVIKALFEAKLLPDVICGSSIGALIAGGVCSRTDAELAELFEDVGSVYRYGIKFLAPGQVIRRKVLLDQDQLLRCAQENAGDYTFAEAKSRSGRSLCITVSPVRARQKPRVLSAATSPDVLVPRAITASAAVSGLYPPVVLQMRGRDGAVTPYLPAERWIDGTFQGDLPTQRLARLFNVNHTIVSQVNPHVLPFLRTRDARGLTGMTTDLAMSSMRVQATQTLKVLQARVKNDRFHNLVEHARLLAEQDYRGDTNIHPPMSVWLYRKMLSNPSPDDLRRYVQMGERATWPKLALICNQTRIARELAACERRLTG